MFVRRSWRTPLGAFPEIVDVPDLAIVLFLQFAGKTLARGDTLELALDTIQEAAVLRVWPVVSRSLPANPQIQIHLDRIPTHTQIFEARAQERHLRYVAVGHRMLRGNLRHHSGGGEDLKHIQSLHH